MDEQAVYVPLPGSEVPHVGTYRRVLPVSLERMYENTIDWEHLPWQHASSFSAIRCLEAGDWGWRAEVTSHRGDVSLLELTLDRSCRRWITRNLAGRSKGAEIWTQVWPRSARQIEIVVDFFVPGVPEAARAKVGDAYARAYRTLYDEDVAMMVERQRQLDARASAADATAADASVDIAIAESGHAVLRWQGRDWQVERIDGHWRAWPHQCPHQLGPLSRQGAELQCPWHGYRFDLDTGACLTGQACRLPTAPRIQERDGRLYID